MAAEVLGRADTLGSLAPGKEANLVLLDRNPLAVQPMDIRDIMVYATVYRGRFNPIVQK